MTEQLNAIVATTRTPKQPETAPSPSGEFSFGAAMAALEQNAAQALQAHGGAPQSASVADGGGSRAAKQNTSSSAPETIISDDRGNAKPASANLSDDHRPTKNVAPGAQQQSLPTPQPAATATLNIAAPVAVNGAPPLATQPNTARFDAAGAPKTATTKPDAATAARAAAPHAPKQAPESFARLLAQRLDQGETRFELRLDPPELGRVEARLNVGKDGETLLALKFDNQEALDLFAKDRAALQTMLSDLGFSLDGEALSFSLSDHEYDESVITAENAATINETVTSPAQWSAPPQHSSGAIDIFI